MSFTSFGCRFCLKTIQPNEKMALIDEEVKSQFVGLTQIKLDFMEGLSKVVCEVCLRSVQLATALKLQFVENQKKLYSEIQDIQMESEAAGINPILHDIQESEKDQQKPVPQFIDTSIAKTVPIKSSPKKSPAAKKRKISPKKEVVSENTSNNSFDMQDAPSFSMEPEVNIKEEQFEEDEIPFQHELFDRFNYSDTNPIDSDSDPSNMLEELTTESVQSDSKGTRKKIIVKSSAPGERIFPCVYCGKQYNKRHMNRHINVEHKKIKFPCVVPDCTSSYSRKEKLRLHIQTKHINCSEDEYAELMEKFRNLKPIYENGSHVDITPNIKYYCVVSDCQDSFTQKKMLKVHITEKHSVLSKKEMTNIMKKFEALDPVYEMFEDTGTKSKVAAD